MIHSESHRLAVAVGTGDRADKILGVLLGTACGDAVSSPLGRGSDNTPRLSTHPVHSGASLEHTDGTVQAAAVAEELCEVLHEQRPFSEDRLVRRLARAWQANPRRTYGSQTSAMLARYLKGARWQDAREQPDGPASCWGDAAAARVSPAAIVTVEFAELARLASRIAHVTHAHPLAIDGAVLQALAVAGALASDPGEELDPGRFIGALQPHLLTHEYIDATTRLQQLVSYDMHPRLAAAALRTDIVHISSILMALLMFLCCPDDPAQAIRHASRVTDRNLAPLFTGALAGARCGASALPAAWMARVPLRSYLTGLAAQLHIVTSAHAATP